ncbi:hypothetical protein L218DRAFT_306188 [Marasmius fiardii PR-910]|nr:hypothetical protein L218DRAFT_306188 [Marasmius fiardii PR-910]
MSMYQGWSSCLFGVTSFNKQSFAGVTATETASRVIISRAVRSSFVSGVPSQIFREDEQKTMRKKKRVIISIERTMICGLTHQNEQPSRPSRFECSGKAASHDRTLPTKLSSQSPEKGKERESVAPGTTEDYYGLSG